MKTFFIQRWFAALAIFAAIVACIYLTGCSPERKLSRKKVDAVILRTEYIDDSSYMVIATDSTYSNISVRRGSELPKVGNYMVSDWPHKLEKDELHPENDKVK